MSLMFNYIVTHHIFPHFTILSWDNNIKVDTKQDTRTWTGGDWLKIRIILWTQSYTLQLHETDKKLIKFIDYLSENKIPEKESVCWK
jgi:hypothetical protein